MDLFQRPPDMLNMLVCINAFIAGCATMTSLYYIFKKRFTKPLDALVDTITEFSVDPTVVVPIPDEISDSPTFRKAAEALDELQRSTLKELRQRERQRTN